MALARKESKIVRNMRMRKNPSASTVKMAIAW